MYIGLLQKKIYQIRDVKLPLVMLFMTPYMAQSKQEFIF
jgi:hypothetical protein